MEYAVFNRPIVTIYDVPDEIQKSEENVQSAIADEGLYGMICKVLAAGGQDEAAADLPEGWAKVVTFYGYPGYVHVDELACMGEGKMRSWLANRFVQLGRATDVMAQPASSSVRLMTLERGSRLERLPERRAGEEDNGSPVREDGWARVRLIDGQQGYVRSVALGPQRYSLSAVFYLEEDTPFAEALARARGLAPAQMLQNTLDTWFAGSEDAFRQEVCDTAKQYLGTQYRWGGKTTRGIDCSGLTSMAYLQNGVLLYRDAKIVPGWPVHEIAPEAKKPGDLLYFPGHIALYLGEGCYIHSTGAAASGGVVINSLDPDDPRYRADLPALLTAVGSVF